MTFDVVATANDFRCFLRDQAVPHSEFLTGDLACDDAARTTPFPVFRAAAITGRNDGVPTAHGLTHPDYLRPELKNDGTAKPEDPNLQNAPDMGALILVEPVTDITPLPLRAPGELDTIPDLVGTPAVSVGYGLDWTKITGQKPTRDLGPLTFGGDNGIEADRAPGADPVGPQERAVAAAEPAERGRLPCVTAIRARRYSSSGTASSSRSFPVCCPVGRSGARDRRIPISVSTRRPRTNSCSV